MSSAIRERIQYEAFGEEGGKHNPKWGNEIISGQKGKIKNILFGDFSIEPLIECLSSSSNHPFLTVANEWNLGSTESDLSNVIWASYGTSGTETNGKEFLQLMALISFLRRSNSSIAGLYMIDTASHPMRDQLLIEGKMYADVASLSPEDILTRYINLFQGRVDPDYLREMLDFFPSTQKQELESKWRKERVHDLNVPGDAIGLPDQSAYEDFLNAVSIHPDVINEIMVAYDDLQRSDLPKTLGSLRCVIFTRVGNLIARKIGIHNPIIAVPFDEVANRVGWGEKSLSEIAHLVRDIAGTDRVAFYNVVDPKTGKEIQIMTDLQRKPSNSELRTDDEFISSVLSMPYKVACKMGHLSGMGYYRLIIGIPTGFVLDNYEASGPHRRILEFFSRRDQNNDPVPTFFAPYCRGWVRHANVCHGPNLTFGASPPIEPLASEILKYGVNIPRVRAYLKMLNLTIGQNSTIALEFEHSGASIWYVPDNTSYAKAREEIRINNPQRREILFQIRKFEDISSKLADLESQRRKANEEFENRFSDKLRKYYANRVEAIRQVSGVEISTDGFDMMTWKQINELADKLFRERIQSPEDKERVKALWEEMNKRELGDFLTSRDEFKQRMTLLTGEIEKLRSELTKLQSSLGNYRHNYIVKII